MICEHDTVGMYIQNLYESDHVYLSDVNLGTY